MGAPATGPETVGTIGEGGPGVQGWGMPERSIFFCGEQNLASPGMDMANSRACPR